MEVKTVIGAALALGLTVGGAGVAVATSGSIGTLSTTGAQLTSGRWSFDPWPCTSACHSGISGFNYSGTLKDTSADGNNPFVHAKPDAYGYATRIYNYGGNGTQTAVSQKVWDTNGDPATTAQVQVCRDRGTLLPDNCVTSAVFRR